MMSPTNAIATLPGGDGFRAGGDSFRAGSSPSAAPAVTSTTIVISHVFKDMRNLQCSGEGSWHHRPESTVRDRRYKRQESTVRDRRYKRQESTVRDRRYKRQESTVGDRRFLTTIVIIQSPIRVPRPPYSVLEGLPVPREPA
jgi:hypothetical protein